LRFIKMAFYFANVEYTPMQGCLQVRLGKFFVK
jgi:hypothetical protein